MKTLKIKITEYADRDLTPILAVASTIFKKHTGVQLDFHIKKVHQPLSYFKTLPWYEDKKDKYYLNRNWIEKNIADEEYDISVGTFNDNQWRAKYNNSIGGTAEASPINGRGVIYMTATEGQTKTLVDGGKRYSEFLWRLLHEICHVAFDDLMDRPDLDKTHWWDYEQKNLIGALEQIDLSNYVTVEERKDKLKLTLSLLKKVVSLYRKLLGDNNREKTMIEKWAEAIKEFEDYVLPGGFYRDGTYAPNGSLSYRLKNPGNVRWSKYQAGTKNNYAYFTDYETGWKALLYQLRIATDGRSGVYSPNDTLLEFTSKYAPSSDNNYPEKYAKFVANELGVTIDTEIGTFKT